MRIQIPANGWAPRDYQRPAWDALERGMRRALLFWHRRSGKDEIALHRAAVAAHERIGAIWHMLPEAAQARKAIWDAINPHTGRKRIDEAFPVEIRESTRDNDMFIKFKSGSSYQVVGSDNYNSLVGAPPVGLIGSEWALSKPQAWAFLRPVLLENNGWAMFITTPRGKNHAKRLLDTVKDSPDWFCQTLTALQTKVFTPEQLLNEQRELIGEHGEAVGRALYRQEYMCDFDAPVVGAVYPEEMQKAKDTGRITRVPHDPNILVNTYWDLGFGDTNCIWFEQQVHGEVRLIDYVEGNKKGIDFYAKQLNDRDYNYGTHWLPHDGNSGHISSGKSPRAVLEPLVRGSVKVAPRLPVEHGVKLVRALLARCVFDEAKTGEGVDGLVNYRRDVNSKTNEEGSNLVHDWASHPADAFRTLAVALDEPAREAKEEQGSEFSRRSSRTSDDWMGA